MATAWVVVLVVMVRIDGGGDAVNPRMGRHPRIIPHPLPVRHPL